MVSKFSIAVDEISRKEDGIIIIANKIDGMPPTLSEKYHKYTDDDNNNILYEDSRSSRKSIVRDLFYEVVEQKAFNFSDLISDLHHDKTESKVGHQEEDFVEMVKDVIETITIMDEKNPRAQQVLSDFNGHLCNISLLLVGKILKKSPTQFTAKVNDFNDNLFYKMQERGSLRNIIQHDEEVAGDDSSYIENCIKELEANIRQIIGGKKGNNDMAYQGSFMKTEQTQPQPAHVDFKWETLDALKKELFIGFFPLSKEGMFLQLWDDCNNNKDDTKESTNDSNNGRIIFIPLGKFLVIPSDTIHGGGFKVGDGGNPRFHMYIASDESVLPQFQNNRYTEKHDRSKELCDRFKNSPKLESLIGDFFDTS